MAGSFPQLIERLNKEAIEGETESAKVLSIQVEMPSGPDAEWSMVFLRRLATPKSRDRYCPEPQGGSRREAQKLG